MIEKNVVGVEKKDDQFPVFKSDILTNQDLIAPVSGVSGVGAISPVSATASSIDAVDIWRYMSEKYKNQRLLKQKQSKIPASNTSNVNKEIDSFQNSYEVDSLDVYSLRNNSHESWYEDLINKVWDAHLPSDISQIELHKPEDDEDKEEETENDGILRVKNVMSKNIISVIDSTKIEQVITLFTKYKIHSVPVVHYRSKFLVGIISMTDIIKHIFERDSKNNFRLEGTFFVPDNKSILEFPVSKYMNERVIQIDSDLSVKDACRIMNENKIHRLIVTRNSKVKGIFSSSDAVRILSDL